MLDSLKSLISTVSDIPLTEWPNFVRILKTKTLARGESLFRQGEASEIIAFVQKGLVYTYYLSHQHEKKVKKFSWEGRITSPYSTLLSGEKICYFSCEALEETKIIYILFSDLQHLYERHACWQKMGRRFVEKALVEREKREYETLCLPLTQRYENFVRDHAKIIDRIPQYLIASFLGINPVSLSRLRGARANQPDELS